MAISPVQPFEIDHESEADAYLEDLLKHPKYRSMHEVEHRANTLIKDARIREYFITKAKEILARAS